MRITWAVPSGVPLREVAPLVVAVREESGTALGGSMDRMPKEPLRVSHPAVARIATAVEASVDGLVPAAVEAIWHQPTPCRVTPPR